MVQSVSYVVADQELIGLGIEKLIFIIYIIIRLVILRTAEHMAEAKTLVHVVEETTSYLTVRLLAVSC